MATEYTPAVERALQAAQQSAHRHVRPAVVPVDLLLGLIAEDEGRAAELLTRAGLDVATTREMLGGTPEEAAALPEVELPLADACRDILHAAQAIAGRVNVDSALATEQVLLAL